MQKKKLIIRPKFSWKLTFFAFMLAITAQIIGEGLYDLFFRQFFWFQ